VWPQLLVPVTERKAGAHSSDMEFSFSDGADAGAWAMSPRSVLHYIVTVFHGATRDAASLLGLPCTSAYALGVVAGVAVRCDVPVALRLCDEAWQLVLRGASVDGHGAPPRHSRVSRAAAAFRLGFGTVVPWGVVRHWSPADMRVAVCGNDNVDVGLLRSSAVYEAVSCCAASRVCPPPPSSRANTIESHHTTTPPHNHHDVLLATIM
jgi:hypothetical protein